ncbi:hypothetical protein B0H16DRAFT_1742922 [Mycena metata]|uniref:Uncharacterized protein n=1 Tax=Mycena metata TaxID=1033252 RepID=A0AAD7H716_9AGAR|nr:hypothetical protein B0H16DRAFT_1742922 [Mycena metata]
MYQCELLELVYLILYLAEYWVADTTERTQAHEVAASRTPNNNASTCSVLTPPIRKLTTENIHLKIARVQFTTVSRDQGRGTEEETEGTFTWFEAAILRRRQLVPSVPSSIDSWLATAIDEVIPMDKTPGFEPYNPAAEVKDARGSSRWTVQSNVTSDEFHTHTLHSDPM